MSQHYLFNITAEDRPGLVHKLTGTISKGLVPIKSINASANQEGLALITLDIVASTETINKLIHKLRAIIEVIQVDAVPKSEAVTLSCGLYVLDKAFTVSEANSFLKSYRTDVVDIHKEHLVIAHFGREREVDKLFSKIGSQYLKSFRKSAPVLATLVTDNSDPERISRLAA